MTTTDTDTTWTTTAITVNENGYWNATDTAEAVYVGRSEFFTGLKYGDLVTVNRTTYYRADGSISNVSYAATKGGAWLAVNVATLAF
jgi:predicted RNA-binding protein (virulence factor B family)